MEAWVNKGAVLCDLDRSEEAIACYNKALEINPRYAKLWYNKGVALIALGRPKEAISAFQQFIECAPPQYASDVEKIEELIQQLKEMV